MRREAAASFAGPTQGSGSRPGRLGLVCLCLLGIAAFLGSGAPAAGAQTCPNGAFRQGPSSKLPDCRAYELVSPADTGGQDVVVTGSQVRYDGNAVAFISPGAFGDSVSAGGATGFIARRGAGDWTSEGISPPIDPYQFLITSYFPALSQDFSKAAITGTAEPPLTPEASAGTPNMYLRSSDGSYQLITVGSEPDLGGFTEWFLRGVSDDLEHVVFEAEYPLTGCGGPATERLCDWDAATGTLSRVGVLPGGGIATSAVSLAQYEAHGYQRAVSADGSRIFFEGGGEGCGICVRIDGATTQVVSGPGSRFEIASSDGSLAYVVSGGELERYFVGADELTPLTAGGQVQGVFGASADGSRVYFVAKAELAPGATAGEENLYLWTEGAGFKFIATGNTSGVFKGNRMTANALDPPTSRVTPDGMHLAFTANNSLTGYPDEGKSEAYLYSAATGELVCASCNPSGEPATAGAFIEGSQGATATAESTSLSRNLSDDGGHLFFSTSEALVPQDANSVTDVYEYDAASGAVALISSGTGAGGVEFIGASASGDDAVFLTRQQLVGTDPDDALSIYDARVDGGLASQNPPPPAPSCTGEGCRGETSTPSLAAATSSGFAGKGNLPQKQNCNKPSRKAKKLSNRAKRLRRHGKQAKRNGKSTIAKKRNRKATRLAKRARNESKSAKRCRKANRRASK